MQEKSWTRQPETTRNQAKIACRGEIVEVGVLFRSCFQLIPGLAEFSILHLQLDLVHLQFVFEPQ